MKKCFSSFWIFLSFVFGSAIPASAEVTLPNCFTNNAVLQRDHPICVWGWANPDEEIKVSFNGTSASTKALADKTWKVELPAQPASFQPQELVIQGDNRVVFSNVLVGEVWICSGQSNMEMPLYSWGQKLKGTDNPRLACTEEELTGDFSYIRFNRAHHVVSDEPQTNFATDGWKVCKAGVQKDCTAVGFHFAQRLYNELNVPVGLIDSNWGGSNINSWIPDEGWNQLPETKEIGKQLISERATATNPGAKCGGMYNAMLAPWINYGFRGAIWYQGCTNAGEREFYYFKQKAMIREWRKVFNNGDFPFYWVQLAPFTAPTDNPNQTGDWPYLRNGQTQCLEVPFTGQAVIIDAGEADDIHPTNKYIVGNRLALWALDKIFNKDVESCSPMVKNVAFDADKVTITFENVGAGLVTGRLNDRIFEQKSNETVKNFAIADADGNYVWANAEIVGKDTVVISNKDVANPSAVRYAFQMCPTECNLYSAEGLPACPFELHK